MDREIEMMRESMNGRIFREKDERIAELEAEVERLETTLESFAAVDRARQAENAKLNKLYNHENKCGAIVRAENTKLREAIKTHLDEYDLRDWCEEHHILKAALGGKQDG